MTEKNKKKMQVGKMEAITRTPDAKKMHKKWKAIANELNDREISMVDINKIMAGTSKKYLGLEEVCKDHNISASELMFLGQQSKSILEQDTKATEFCRDTAGEKPVSTIDIGDRESVFKDMTKEQLLEIREAYADQAKKEEK